MKSILAIINGMKIGYKLIEVPYLGMEHQSAVTYGNGFSIYNGVRSKSWQCMV